MLNEQPFFKMLMINVFLGIIWHFAMLFFCVAKKNSSFNPNKKLYQAHKWERDGRFYSDTLRINRWKDLLPQHVGKDGFSKEHLENNMSIEYIDQFILETCRGEWNHTMNCTFAFALLLLNNLSTALVLSALLLLGNLPFIAIQRYNRLRLQKLRKIILKKSRRQQSQSSSFSENTI